jgi:ribosomal protein S18 acetylase RimI-like enzyme
MLLWPVTMKDKVAFRQATSADIQTLAQLWVTSFPNIFGPILGDKANRVICDWLRLSERHLQTTTVAEIEHVVVGFIILDTPAAPRADSGRWLWHALQLHNGIFGALRAFVLMVLINNNHRLGADEVYIEMLGVAPAWRGSGLGEALITYAKSVAQTQGATRLTLHVTCGNQAALKLYRKMGFEITRQQKNRVLKWITGESSYFEMVKKVEVR